jgi:small subunit ribosomal protein S20
MPNTSSAKKALRSSLKKREFNTISKLKVRNSLKELRKVVKTEPAQYQPTLSKAFSALDKAVKTKLIHKNTAARKKSRLAKLVTKSITELSKAAE